MAEETGAHACLSEALPESLPESLITRFEQIVGPRNARRVGPGQAQFLEEPRGLHKGTTPLVLQPASTREVSEILKLAQETGTKIVPQGGNTGLVGGQIPDRSGQQIMLSLSRMTAVRDLDLGSNTITVEAGVVLEALQNMAADAGRFFPLSLGAQGSCQIGGNLATNAGGTGVLAYGNMRDLCLGLEVVLPSGEILNDLRKLKKDNTGFDLRNLFIGSEGCLGVITAAVLKLFAPPVAREVAWIGVRTPEAALALFHGAQAKAGVALTAFELMSARAVEFTLRHHPGARAPLPDAYPWQVLMEISSHRSAQDAQDLMEGILSEAFEAGHVMDAALATSLGQAQAFWGLREAMSDVQGREGASIKHDISVPVALVPAFLAAAEPVVLAQCAGARIACFGHMGDGNLHYNISQPEGMERDAFLALYGSMNGAVHDLATAFAGSISAEHGIGTMKRAALAVTKDPVALALMRRIKTTLDPMGIMNPDKVL